MKATIRPQGVRVHGCYRSGAFIQGLHATANLYLYDIVHKRVKDVRVFFTVVDCVPVNSIKYKFAFSSQKQAVVIDFDHKLSQNHGLELWFNKQSHSNWIIMGRQARWFSLLEFRGATEGGWALNNATLEMGQDASLFSFSDPILTVSVHCMIKVLALWKTHIHCVLPQIWDANVEQHKEWLDTLMHWMVCCDHKQQKASLTVLTHAKKGTSQC